MRKLAQHLFEVYQCFALTRTYAVADDGLERVFASHFISPFLLSCLLVPTLTRYQPSAIMHVVSNGGAAARRMKVNMDLVKTAPPHAQPPES